MKLVPGDDAALIAASNLGTADCSDTGPFSSEDCRVAFFAAWAELERREERHRLAVERLCERCGKGFTQEDLEKNGAVQQLGLEFGGYIRRAHLACLEGT